MKTPKTLLNIILAAALAVPVVASVATAGTPARDVLANHSLTALDGSKGTLSSFRGDVVVVNFWASWCAPCRKELPVFDEWNAQWHGHGARVVTISIDKDKRKAAALARKIGLVAPVYHDGPAGLARKIDLPSVPCTLVLDRAGNVVKMVESSSLDDLDSVKHEVESLLSARGKTQRADMGAGASDGGRK